MCKHTKSHYTLCAHTRSTTTRCPSYTLNIFQKYCTTEASESTHFSLCPKGCTTRPTEGSGKEVSIMWVSEEEGRSFESSGSLPIIADTQGRRVWPRAWSWTWGKHAGEGGVRLMSGGIERGSVSGGPSRGSRSEEAERGIGDESRIGTGTGTREEEWESTTSSDSDTSLSGRPNLSLPADITGTDSLAEGYRWIIGAPVPSLLETGGGLDGAQDSSRLETITTWSRFLDRPMGISKKSPVQTNAVAWMNGDEGGVEVGVAASRKCSPRADIGLLGEQQRDRSSGVNTKQYRGVKSGDCLREDLKLADERLRCVRDGRGA